MGPAIFAPWDQISGWRVVKDDAPAQEITAYWHRTLAKVTPLGHRLMGVAGLISATVVTLLGMGWQPTHPHRWVSPDDIIWELHLASQPLTAAPLREAVMRSADRLIWKASSLRRDGAGLQHGFDLAAIRRYQDRLRKAHQHGLHCILQAAVVG